MAGKMMNESDALGIIQHWEDEVYSHSCAFARRFIEGECARISSVSFTSDSIMFDWVEYDDNVLRDEVDISEFFKWLGEIK
jgi:hypothetical protein